MKGRDHHQNGIKFSKAGKNRIAELKINGDLLIYFNKVGNHKDVKNFTSKHNIQYENIE